MRMIHRLSTLLSDKGLSIREILRSRVMGLRRVRR
jgi:hypothetical protein